MIISASRRTDIPAFYSDWLFNRLQAGSVLVRNPRNPHQISQISLSPDVVDGIVFWTKNPIPMLSRLDELHPYPYYIQFTLNAYGTDIEPFVPPKGARLVPAFQQLASLIGKERVLWRYDPILISASYTAEYHVQAFRKLAEKLADFTEVCTVSFLDFYRNTQRNTAGLGIISPSFSQKEELLEKLNETAKVYGLQMFACAEDGDYRTVGVLPASCIDRRRMERISGAHLDIGKDKNQRTECGCCESIDIGAYNTCGHGCRYCYANYIPQTVSRNRTAHNPLSPLLFGEITPEDQIRKKEMQSCKIWQCRLD